MSEYTARVRWVRQADEAYTDNRYSRGHEWSFDGGAVIAASSFPHVVPPPYSVETYVDPEEAFVASLSSCHMLFFLSIAGKKRFVVDEYVDDAIGVMEEDDRGKVAMTRVTLCPDVTFSGERRPSAADVERIHHLAHESCFIANSVRTAVAIEPVVR
ncbi:MAG: OsmC family peroxiredoxin [Acidobacteria bacterium]|nr:OsmC family peroxiredoxin [Acidobacteriota bacterium]